MTKRRITQQQSTRIQKKQDAYHTACPTEKDSALNQTGLIITRFGKHAELETNEKQRIQCSIRSNMAPIVAGDHVIWQKTSEDQGVIVSCCPRQSVLGRPTGHGVYKPVAANITQLLIVVAPKPEISWSLLDCYLIMAELLQLSACIILNKMDLEHQAIQQTLETCYQVLGYPTLYTQQDSLQGHLALNQQLNQQTSVFVGQSGVGKSSLIASVLPDEIVHVGALSTQSELGRHTTSHSRLYHLPQGGSLIDSPGVREFGLWKVSRQDILYGFREFRPLAVLCKFRNCLHVNTPGCAIVDAVEKNICSKMRYESLLNLTEINDH